MNQSMLYCIIDMDQYCISSLFYFKILFRYCIFVIEIEKAWKQKAHKKKRIYKRIESSKNMVHPIIVKHMLSIHYSSFYIHILFIYSKSIHICIIKDAWLSWYTAIIYCFLVYKILNFFCPEYIYCELMLHDCTLYILYDTGAMVIHFYSITYIDL